MDSLLALKKKGNDQYLDDDYQASCVTYGKVLSEMMTIEQAAEGPLDTEFNKLKSVLFNNLAAANLKLHDYEAVRRCCNASMVFLNEPDLPMLDLGLEERDGDNILDNSPLKEPVPENSRGPAGKILYRRSCALYAMATTAVSLKVVREDLLLAEALQPKDKQITNLIREVTAKMESLDAKGRCNGVTSETEGSQYFAVSINPEREGLMINGGPCLKRKGHWSQTVESATAYLPLANFVGSLEEVNACGATSCGIDGSMTVAVKRGVGKSDLTVTMEREGVSIGTDSSSDRHYLPLEYYIDPSTSTWQLDTLYTPKDVQEVTQAQAPLPPSHLVLHLVKVPSIEWFPGCEWWTGVFARDEAIDTTTCSVGTDSRQLPEAAVTRAEGEHRRFLELGEREREREVAELMRLKRETVAAVDGEERALQAALAQQPGRSEMLGALSSEFPGIFFGASTGDGAGAGTAAEK